MADRSPGRYGLSLLLSASESKHRLYPSSVAPLRQQVVSSATMDSCMVYFWESTPGPGIGGKKFVMNNSPYRLPVFVWAVYANSVRSICHR